MMGESAEGNEKLSRRGGKQAGGDQRGDKSDMREQTGNLGQRRGRKKIEREAEIGEG